MEGTPTETTSTGATPQPRQVVAKYATYPEAERAVDKLSDSGFPVERVAIVGTGLRLSSRWAGVPPPGGRRSQARLRGR